MNLPLVSRLNAHRGIQAPPRPAPEGRRGVLVMLAYAVAALIFGGIIGGTTYWYATGGRWMTIETASMGQGATVGTLVVTKPCSVGSLHPGELVSFTAGPAKRTYTHRVVSVKDGVVETQGDANGTPDPWETTQAQLVGRVVGQWYGMGYLIKGLPMLAFGLLALWGLRLKLPASWRHPANLFGCPAIVAFILSWLHPLVGVSISGSSGTDHGLVANVISIGMFPAIISAKDGTQVHLLDGQQGQVVGRSAGHAGRLDVIAQPDLHGWWLVLVIGVSILPLVWALLTPTPVTPTPEVEEAA